MKKIDVCVIRWPKWLTINQAVRKRIFECSVGIVFYVKESQRRQRINGVVDCYRNHRVDT